LVLVSVSIYIPQLSAPQIQTTKPPTLQPFNYSTNQLINHSTIFAVLLKPLSSSVSKPY
jgi:hypothetical protein